MCLATFLLGTSLSSPSVLWALCLVLCLVFLGGFYVICSAISELKSFRSELKSMNSTTLRPGLPPSILNLEDWRYTTKRIAGAMLAMTLVSGVGLWYAVHGSHKRTYHYDQKATPGRGIEVVNEWGSNSWEVRFPDALQTEVIKTCGDPLPLKRGMVMTTFEYYDVGLCMFIDQNCEIDYLRDSATNVVDRDGRELFTKEK